VTADSLGRRLYVARSGPAGHLAVFNLDTLVGNGDIPNVSGHGATVNMKYGHGFITSKPVVMFDSKTLAVIKTLDVKGNPDGYLDDPFNDHVYILSHTEPNVTVIDAKDGAILGTIDLGGAPEQAASDGRGGLYIDIEDKNSIAVVDATTMSMTGKFDISNHGGGCAGLALDVKNEVLFASCRDKNNMIVLSAKDGRVLADLPIGKGPDGTIFNATTNEAFSSQGDGTLTVIKEKLAYELCCGADCENAPSLQDANARYQNREDFSYHGRVWRDGTHSRGPTLWTRSDNPGLVLDCHGRQVILDCFLFFLVGY